MAATLDRAVARIHDIQETARAPEAPLKAPGRIRGSVERPRWPMIVLRTPKGWTGPKEVDGKPVEGTFRSHQVPLAEVRTNPGHLELLDAWMRSYRPEELFDERGAALPSITELAPRGDRRMSANPNANGGILLPGLSPPDFRPYGVEVAPPGASSTQPTPVLGPFLPGLVARKDPTFHLFRPDTNTAN